jgi:hypothetical protein
MWEGGARQKSRTWGEAMMAKLGEQHHGQHTHDGSPLCGQRDNEHGGPSCARPVPVLSATSNVLSPAAERLQRRKPPSQALTGSFGRPRHAPPSNEAPVPGRLPSPLFPAVPGRNCRSQGQPPCAHLFAWRLFLQSTVERPPNIYQREAPRPVFRLTARHSFSSLSLFVSRGTTFVYTNPSHSFRTTAHTCRIDFCLVSFRSINTHQIKSFPVLHPLGISQK